jgi:hypothetical protein
MQDTILAHTEPGQRALVVCKKELFDNRNVPHWPENDKRFKRPETYQQEYAWDLQGRKLCATHWGGLGIGVNHWREADVVFLFGEFHQPRRVTIARAQGLISAKATEGPLATMKALNSKSPQVDDRLRLPPASQAGNSKAEKKNQRAAASANFARRTPRHPRTLRSTTAAAVPALSKMDLQRAAA